jgi:hypothetical protein
MNTPAELRYTRSDERVRIEGEIATIGITYYAQSELGDIVFLELPEPRRYLQVDEVFGVIESVKAASDLYAPVKGEVMEVNESLQAALVDTRTVSGYPRRPVYRGRAARAPRVGRACAVQTPESARREERRQHTLPQLSERGRV